MAVNINLLVMSGTILAQPVSGISKNGHPYVSFTLLNIFFYHSKTKTQYVRCTAFGDLATIIGTHVKEGDKITITGMLYVQYVYLEKRRRYENLTKILVSTIEFNSFGEDGGRTDHFFKDLTVQDIQIEHMRSNTDCVDEDDSIGVDSPSAKPIRKVK